MENISIPRNFADAVVGGVADFPISIASALGYEEKAQEWEDYVKRNFPTEPGVSSFLGSVVGGSLPTIPAVLMGGTGLAAYAPKVFTGVRALTTGAYVGQAVGTARREIAEEEKRTGQDISGLREATAALGYGTVTLAAEHFGLQNLIKNVGSVAPETVRRLGYAIGNKKIDEASKILSYMGKVTAKSAGQEGLQEVTEQIAQNIVSKAVYDTDRSILENAGYSFIGGAIGGGLVHGIGVGSAAKDALSGLKEGIYDSRSYAKALKEIDVFSKELEEESEEVSPIMGQDKARRFGIADIDNFLHNPELSVLLEKRAKNPEDIFFRLKQAFPKLKEKEQKEIFSTIDKVIGHVNEFSKYSIEKAEELLKNSPDKVIDLEKEPSYDTVAAMVKMATAKLSPKSRAMLERAGLMSIMPYTKEEVDDIISSDAIEQESLVFDKKKAPEILRTVKRLASTGRISEKEGKLVLDALNIGLNSIQEKTPTKVAVQEVLDVLGKFVSENLSGWASTGDIPSVEGVINDLEKYTGLANNLTLNKLIPAYKTKDELGVNTKVSFGETNKTIDPVELARVLYAAEILKKRAPTAWALLSKNPSSVIEDVMGLEIMEREGYNKVASPNTGAFYKSGANVITIPANQPSVLQAVSLLSHELRHAIQWHTNPSITKNYNPDQWDTQPAEIDAQEYAWETSIWAAKEIKEGRIIQFQTSPYISTETEAFKKRFEGSKVVDLKGRPLPLYHGTPAVFTKFRQAIGGIHFGNPSQVDSRILAKRRLFNGDTPFNVIPCFLDIKKPFVCVDVGSHDDIETFIGMFIDDRDINFPASESAISNAFVEEARGLIYKYYDFYDQPIDPSSTRRIEEQKFYLSNVIPFLNKYGFDGIIYKNTGEQAGSYISGVDIKNVEQADALYRVLREHKKALLDNVEGAAVQITRNNYHNRTQTYDAYSIIEDALDYFYTHPATSFSAIMENKINNFLSSYLSFSHVARALIPLMEEAGIDVSNVKVNDNLSYAVFDSLQIIPMFAPETYMQTGRGTTLATNMEEDILIRHLKNSGIVSNVKKIKDDAEWDRLVQSAAKEKGVEVSSASTYGISIGQEIFLGPRTYTNTAGHELFHAFVNLLGSENTLVQQGIDLLKEEGFTGKDGNMDAMEALADLVGDVYYKRKMEAGLFHKVMQWLNDFWLEVKRVIGGRITPEQVATLINRAMDNPGLIRNSLGLPPEWKPIDERIKANLRKYGLVQEQGDTVSDVIMRMMSLYDKAVESMGVFTKGYPKVEEIPTELRSLWKVYSDNSNLQQSEIMKAMLTLSKDKAMMEAEIRKVIEGRFMEYNAYTNVAWYYLVEEGRRAAFVDFLSGDDTDAGMREVMESIKRVTADYETKVVHPASMSGYNLKFWDEHRTVQNLLKNLERLKSKLSSETYNILFQVATGQMSSTSPEAQKAITEALKHPSGKDLFYEFYYSNILSNPTTHLVNFFTNALWLSWQVPHRLLEGLAAKVTGNNVYMREIVPLIFGSRSFSKIGRKAVKVILKKGYLEEGDVSNLFAAGIMDKFEYELGVSAAAAWERHPTLKRIAPAITWSSRALRAADLYFRTIALGRQVTANVYRYALQQGVKDPLGKARLAANMLVALDVKDTKSLPSISKAIENLGIKMEPRTIVSIIEDSLAFANYATFMDAPGKATEKIIELRDNIPFGKLFIPFVNTVMNIAKRGLEMTPGVGLVSYNVMNRDRERKGKITKPFRRTSADIIAKQIEGAIITAILLRLFDRDEITAGVPSNPAEREHFYTQGKLPWSFRAGGTWIQYRDIEPFSTIFAMLGAVYEAIGKAKDDTTKTEIFQQAASSLYSYIAESTWAGALTKLGDSYKLKQQIARIPANLLPSSAAFVALNKGLDSVSTGKRVLMERPETFYDEVVSNIKKTWPGLGKLVGKEKARLNVWGEEISIPGGFLRQWLPFKWSEEKPDNVEKELARLGVYPAPPSNEITIRRRKYEIPKDEYRNYLLWFGKEAKSRLAKVVARSGYYSLSEERKLRLIDRNLRQVRFQAAQRTRRELLKHRQSLSAPLS